MTDQNRRKYRHLSLRLDLESDTDRSISNLINEAAEFYGTTISDIQRRALARFLAHFKNSDNYQSFKQVLKILNNEEVS